MIKAVIFDLDDTLYCQEEFNSSGFHSVTGQCFAGEKSVYNKMVELKKKGEFKVFDTLLRENGTYNYVNVLEMVYLYRTHTPIIRPHEWVKPFLKELQDKNIKVGIITNGADVKQQNKIYELVIKSLINYYFICDILGRDYWKPSHIPYKIMLNRFHCKANECIYVDDDLEYVQSAMNIGMKGVHVLSNDTVPNEIREVINAAKIMG